MTECYSSCIDLPSYVLGGLFNDIDDEYLSDGNSQLGDDGSNHENSVLIAIQILQKVDILAAILNFCLP